MRVRRAIKKGFDPARPERIREPPQGYLRHRKRASLPIAHYLPGPASAQAHGCLMKRVQMCDGTSTYQSLFNLSGEQPMMMMKK